MDRILGDNNGTPSVDDCGTTLKAGDYKVEWEGSGPEVQVSILRGKNIVAKVPAKLVDLDKNAPNDAAVVKTNVWTAVAAGVHTVIGSSGLTSQDYAELDRLARDRGVGVIAAGNFSVMAAVLGRAASMAAQHLDRWEIIDYALLLCQAAWP